MLRVGITGTVGMEMTYTETQDGLRGWEGGGLCAEENKDLHVWDRDDLHRGTEDGLARLLYMMG